MSGFARYVPADLPARAAVRILAAARRTVVRQTFPAIFVYPAVATWLGTVTGQHARTPASFWSVAGVLAGTMLLRALLLLVVRKAVDQDSRALAAYLWLGVASAAVLSTYVGHVSVTAQESAARHAGLAIVFALGGALVALTSIHRAISIAWVVASLLPMAVVCVVAGDTTQRWLMLLVTPYLVASVRVIALLHRTYWSSHVNAARLDERLAEVGRLSRLAGRAEIAVNVLHDVGNVLNSVLTSTDVLRSELGSCDASLHEVGRMLDVPRDELVAFATHDPRAVVVGPFLRELAEHRDARDERLRNELARLRNRVVHLTHVVSRQQQHARGGSMADVDLDELLDEAVDLVKDAPEFAATAIERPPRTGTRVHVDRHQALQIMVNLLRNARDAMEGSRAPRIEIGMTSDAAAVHLTVTDEGCGFDAATATRLFQHGFTTKPHGHGFGLHNSIMLARAMGGELSARSAGPGLGATFTLMLPRTDAIARARAA